MHSKSLLPFGVVTLTLLAATLAYSWWHNDSCQTLEDNLGQGYFLRWAAPQLLLITAQKESYLVEAENQSQACDIMIEKIRQDVSEN